MPLAEIFICAEIFIGKLSSHVPNSFLVHSKLLKPSNMALGNFHYSRNSYSIVLAFKGAIKMRIYFSLWNNQLCIYLLPTIFVCNGFREPWWNIQRIHIHFLRAEISIIFD